MDDSRRLDARRLAFVIWSSIDNAEKGLIVALDLNSRMEAPLPMNTFRTNFVFTGGKPFEEDNWKKFKIGDVKFEAVKPCARCVITTTDQDTAERFKEPLLTYQSLEILTTRLCSG